MHLPLQNFSQVCATTASVGFSGNPSQVGPCTEVMLGLQLGGCEVGVGVGFWDCDVDMNLLCCDGWPQQDPEEHNWKCSCNGPEGRFRVDGFDTGGNFCSYE